VVAQSAARRGEQRGGPRHSMARRLKGQRGATAKGAARAAAGHGTGKGRRPKGRIVHWARHGQGSAAEGEARLRSKGRIVR
jgi:hypothetical protein